MDSHQTTFERSCKTDPDYQDSSQEFWLGKIKGANKKGGGGGSHEAVGRPYGQQQMILRNLYTYTRQKSDERLFHGKRGFILMVCFSTQECASIIEQK